MAAVIRDAHRGLYEATEGGAASYGVSARDRMGPLAAILASSGSPTVTAVASPSFSPVNPRHRRSSSGEEAAAELVTQPQTEVVNAGLRVDPEERIALAVRTELDVPPPSSAVIAERSTRPAISAPAAALSPVLNLAQLLVEFKAAYPGFVFDAGGDPLGQMRGHLLGRPRMEILIQLQAGRPQLSKAIAKYNHIPERIRAMSRHAALSVGHAELSRDFENPNEVPHPAARRRPPEAGAAAAAPAGGGAAGVPAPDDKPKGGCGDCVVC